MWTIFGDTYCAIKSYKICNISSLERYVKRKRHESEPAVSYKEIRFAKFNTIWVTDFPWVRGSSVHHAFCIICSLDLKFGHGGRHDLRQPKKSERHEKLAGTVQINRRVTYMFQKEESLSKAKVLFTNFIAENNLTILVADHFTYLVQRMFPDSATAQNLRCKELNPPIFFATWLRLSIISKLQNFVRLKKIVSWVMIQMIKRSLH